jgi:hypothetical protein
LRIFGLKYNLFLISLWTGLFGSLVRFGFASQGVAGSGAAKSEPSELGFGSSFDQAITAFVHNLAASSSADKLGRLASSLAVRLGRLAPSLAALAGMLGPDSVRYSSSA